MPEMSHPPGPRRRYSVARVVEAIKVSRGMISTAAESLGCDRRTVERYADRYPAVRQAITEQREAVVDVAESRLFTAIDGSEPWAVSLCLRTIGRGRGYGDVVEVRVEDVRRAFHSITEATVRVLLERLPVESANSIIEALRDEWSRVDL